MAFSKSLTFIFALLYLPLQLLLIASHDSVWMFSFNCCVARNSSLSSAVLMEFFGLHFAHNCGLSTAHDALFYCIVLGFAPDRASSVRRCSWWWTRLLHSTPCEGKWRSRASRSTITLA